MRVYVSARELISREPLCSLTDQTTGFLRFVHTCRTFLHGGSVCGHVTRTHSHLEERPRTAYRCENTFDHAVQPLRRYTYLPTYLPTCRRKIITTSEISKYTYGKCAPGEPYNTMIKHVEGPGRTHCTRPRPTPPMLHLNSIEMY